MAQPELVKDIEARVKKSGDTMTGSLTINHSWPTINLLDPNNPKAIFQVNPEANNVYLGMNNSGIIVGPSDLKYLDSNSVYQNIYHTGNKPTPAEIGVYSKTETNTLLAEKIPYNGETIDPIDFNSIPLNTIRSVSFNSGVDQTNYHTPLGSSTSATWYIVETYGIANRGVQIASLPFSHNRKIYIRYKHDNTWSSWSQLATTDDAVSKAGDTMIGALNFANNTWNKIGDDVQIGDANVAGTLCIQGLNGTTALEFRKYNDLANFGRLSYDGNNFIFERNVYIQHATPNFNIYDTTTSRLFQLYTDDNENNLILNWKSAGNFTQLALLAEKYGTNDIAHLYRYVNNVAEEYNILHSGNFSNYAAKGTGYFTGGDFNTITTSGMYRFNDNASYTNAPSLSWGQMLVIHGAGDTIAQVAFDYSGPNVFLRVGNPPECGGSGAWHGWYRMWVEGNSVTGAVWNDYAECREADTIEPGYVLVETGNDTLTKSTERLSPFAGVSSDTWGFSQGETDKAKTPIAVAGRVLVYPWQDRNNYKPGDCVCAAPEGKVDIMTREEIIQYPDRIVGIVSSVPTYDKWGGGENADREPVDVNGRIWIKVR